MSCPHSCLILRLLICILRLLICVLNAAVMFTASIHYQDVKGNLQIVDQIQDVCCGKEQTEKEKNIFFLPVYILPSVLSQMTLQVCSEILGEFFYFVVVKMHTI